MGVALKEELGSKIHATVGDWHATTTVWVWCSRWSSNTAEHELEKAGASGAASASRLFLP